jgi:hypothetical protein
VDIQCAERPSASRLLSAAWINSLISKYSIRCYNTYMPIEIILKYPRRSLVVAVLVLAALGGVLWWNTVWQNPERVFEDMLANNLSASSVTKYVKAGNKDSDVSQYVRLQMGGTNAAQWLVSARQTGASVTTENVGTPHVGYIRYIHIATSHKNKNGAAYNFHNLLNVWGKGDERDSSLSHLFDQSILDLSSAPLLPIGNLQPEQRQRILSYISTQKVFIPSYKDMKRETIDGRRVYTYQVSVHLGPYVRVMQAFAHDVGVTSLDAIDPNQYAQAPPLTLSVSVDRGSHQLTKISYASTGFSQTYSDWGLRTPIVVPRTTIPASELQRRIQAVQ